MKITEATGLTESFSASCSGQHNLGILNLVQQLMSLCLLRYSTCDYLYSICYTLLRVFMCVQTNVSIGMGIGICVGRRLYMGVGVVVGICMDIIVVVGMKVNVGKGILDVA